MPKRVQIGRYRLEQPLGSGGAASVFLARDEGTGQPVAVKLLRPKAQHLEERARARLRREAKALLKLEHPHVVRLLTVVELGQEGLALVLEYLPGGTLAELLREQETLALEAGLELAAQLADALAAAHAADLLHRDLKPENVLFDGEGTPKLADFGLTRAAQSDSRSSLTKTGDVLGTPGFWAPEQALGRVKQIGPQTDVYGLCALLYALLTGVTPRPPQLTWQQLADALNQPPPLLADQGCPAPAWLERLLREGLAADPGARPAGAAVLRDRLRAGLEELRAPRPERPVWPWALGMVSVSLALSVGVLLVAADGSSPSARPSAGAHHPAAQVAAAEAEAEAEVERALVSGLGLVEADLGDEALEHFDLVLADHPERASLHYGRGRALSRLGHAGAAIAAYERALELDPADVHSAHNRALLLRVEEGPAAGIEAMRRALARKPEFAPALVNLSLFLAEDGRLEEALELLERARSQPAGLERYLLRDKVETLSVELLRALGQRAFQDRAYEVASERFRQGAKVAPTTALRAQLRCLEALARLELGDTERALSCVEQALELDPDNPIVLSSLAAVLKRSGQTTRALIKLQELLERPGLRPATRRLLEQIRDLWRRDTDRPPERDPP